MKNVKSNAEIIISRASMVSHYLKNKLAIDFTLPAVRDILAYQGYSYVWENASSEAVTEVLQQYGFDNLMCIRIVNVFIELKEKLTHAKNMSIQNSRERRQLNWEKHLAHVRRKVEQGKW